MHTIENLDDWRNRYKRWQFTHSKGRASGGEVGESYIYVENTRAPFRPMRAALPMLNLALISSAGAYLDGTEAFDGRAHGGDISFREIPTQIEAEDLQFVARGYDAAAVLEDLNAQIPLTRLAEFAGNGIIGALNPVFWSFCGHIPDAGKFAADSLPNFVERVMRYEVQAALLVPASRLCHQTMGLAARALESAGIPTMMIAVEREITDQVHPPRAAYYNGEFGSVAGAPKWAEFQRRVLDESLRLLEPIDQPGVRKLTVTLETAVEQSRGER